MSVILIACLSLSCSNKSLVISLPGHCPLSPATVTVIQTTKSNYLSFTVITFYAVNSKAFSWFATFVSDSWSLLFVSFLQTKPCWDEGEVFSLDKAQTSGINRYCSRPGCLCPSAVCMFQSYLIYIVLLLDAHKSGLDGRSRKGSSLYQYIRRNTVCR